jgi:hypothetical protein
MTVNGSGPASVATEGDPGIDQLGGSINPKHNATAAAAQASPSIEANGFYSPKAIKRHRCRNPRCRSKLKTPVENDHRAFCCRGCFEAFYRIRCRVCERDITADPMTGAKRIADGRRKFCGRKCASVARANPGMYRGSPERKCRSRSAHSTGLEEALRGEQRAPISGPARCIAAEVWSGQWREVVSGDGVACQVHSRRGAS